MHKIFSNLKGFKFLAFTGVGVCDVRTNQQDLLYRTGDGFRDILRYNYCHFENSDVMFDFGFIFDHLSIFEGNGDIDA